MPINSTPAPGTGPIKPSQLPTASGATPAAPAAAPKGAGIGSDKLQLSAAMDLAAAVDKAGIAKVVIPGVTNTTDGAPQKPPH